MKTLSGKILKMLDWKIKGEFPDVKKSIIIFAPHTSYLDAFFGKLYLNEIGVKHKFISKKELFVFPGTYIMTKFGSIPIDTENGRTVILSVADQLKKSEELHVVLSPEGQLAKTTKWKKGFYYMAQRANIPIVLGYLDFKKKEAGIKGVIYDTKNINSVMQQINLVYKDIQAKYPKDFELDSRFDNIFLS